MRTLLITSDSTFAAAFTLLLEPHGWLVQVLADIESASAATAPDIVNCVFLHSQAIDARSVAGVQALGNAGFEKIFLASSEIAPEWEERAYLSGATYVFQLPFRPQLFLLKLNNLLGESDIDTSVAKPPAGNSASPFRPSPLEVIRDFGRLLRHANDAGTFVERYVSHLRELLGVNKVALYLTESVGDRHLRCASAAGVNAEIAHNIVLPLNSGIARHARQHGIAISLLGPIALDGMTRREMASLGAQLAIPVRDREQLLGVLVVGPTVMGEPIGRDHVELLFMLMEDLGLVLRNARLHSELERERSLFSSILEHMGLGCIAFDRELKLLHSDSVAAACFGIADQKALTFHMLPNRLSALIYAVLEGRESRAEYVQQAPDGGSFLVVVEPTTTGAPGRPAILVLAQNQTQMVAKQRTAIENERRALLERMSSQFSHIFNNAMTGLSTIAQLFPERRNSQEFLDETQRVLPIALRRMRRHVEQIHRLANGEVEAAETIALAPVLQEAWEGVLAFAEVKKRPVLHLPDDSSLVVRGGREALKTIFFEVLLNAVEASPESDVTVTAERSGVSRVRLAVHDKGQGFVNGDGILAGDAFVTKKTTGLGLGLAVVTKLLREQNGALEVGSAYRPGSAAATIILESPQ